MIFNGAFSFQIKDQVFTHSNAQMMGSHKFELDQTARQVGQPYYTLTQGSQTGVREKNFKGTYLREQISYIRTSTTAFRQQSHYHYHFLGLLSLTNQHIITR